jgi:hypothetical protein
LWLGYDRGTIMDAREISPSLTPSTAVLPVGLVVRVLAAATASLVVLGTAVLYPKHILGHDYVYGFVPKFDLDGEINVPTWFSSALLLLAGLLLLHIAATTRREQDRWARHWAFLAWIFVLLSADETGGLHGLLSGPLRGALHLSGALYHAWVLPVGAAVAFLGVAYLRFLSNLPERSRRLFILSGIVYVVGAIGFELPEGMYRTAVGANVTVAYGFLTVFEETFEMIGIVVFIYALLDFIERRWGGVRITLTPAATLRH